MPALAQTPTASTPPAALDLCIGEIVQTSQAYRDRTYWPADRKPGQPSTFVDPWRGIVLGIIPHEGKISALCGQVPTACRCHLDFADDEHPERSRRDCLACRGEGEARWRVLPLGDLERDPNPGPNRGLTRTLLR